VPAANKNTPNAHQRSAVVGSPLSHHNNRGTAANRDTVIQVGKFTAISPMLEQYF
jgi:hypothetical protein